MTSIHDVVVTAIKDVDYRGNAAPGTLVAPVESIEYALKRGGF